MAGYNVQCKTDNGENVDIPLAATYDAAGHIIQNYYAEKTQHEAMIARIEALESQVKLLWDKVNGVV